MAISIAIRCEPCIRAYVRIAVDKGISQDELIEFLEVAMTMQGCPGEEWAPTAYAAYKACLGHGPSPKLWAAAIISRDVRTRHIMTQPRLLAVVAMFVLVGIPGLGTQQASAANILNHMKTSLALDDAQICAVSNIAWNVS